ncbi:hypothetical protein NLO88_22615 [Pseudomonas syringae]|nr:hypothetical protein [Pseudomonas syringae]MDG6400515.1 hypothetical protein [Pseudomonas quasicaspiana]
MISNKTLIKALGTVTAALLLQGCGMIASKTVSDSGLQEKAAVTLNTTPEKVRIFDKRGELDSVKFKAQTNKGVYNCYYTTLVGLDSDTLCSGPVEGSVEGSAKQTGNQAPAPAAAPANCNALLKAAGRC